MFMLALQIIFTLTPVLFPFRKIWKRFDHYNQAVTYWFRRRKRCTSNTLVHVYESEIEVMLSSWNISSFGINVVKPFFREEDKSWNENRNGSEEVVDKRDGGVIGNRNDYDIMTHSKARALKGAGKVFKTVHELIPKGFTCSQECKK